MAYYGFNNVNVSMEWLNNQASTLEAIIKFKHH